jgi:hypothetical protein
MMEDEVVKKEKDDTTAFSGFEWNPYLIQSILQMTIHCGFMKSGLERVDCGRLFCFLQ